MPALEFADHVCFAKTGVPAEYIADQFAEASAQPYPTRKANRVPEWQQMKRMLADGDKLDVPSLYISRACDYVSTTVSFLAPPK